jgi:hypothetical protein
MLDRNIFSGNIQHALPFSKWRELFEDSGFKILEYGSHLSRIFVNMWSIGFRPMFPVLNKMAKLLPSRVLPSIKEEWISILMEFALPFCEEELTRYRKEDGCFHFFVLGK